MNNQQVTGDQITELQNIAYVKQFMRSISIKVITVVSFLKAILGLVVPLLISSTMIPLIQSIISSSGESFSNSDLNMLTSFFGSFGTISSFITFVISLIAPICMVMIIIKAHDAEPTVIARGPIQVLHILSMIQFIFMILLYSVSTIFTIISAVAAGPAAMPSVFVSLVTAFLICAYYGCQTKFLGSVHKSTTGYSLLRDGAKAYGVFSVILSVFLGIGFVVLLICTIIFNSLISSTQIGDNAMIDALTGIFGEAFLKNLTPLLLIATFQILLEMIYQIAVALTSFGYCSTIITAVRASYASSNPYKDSNSRSAFRTYGGGTFQSYDYEANTQQSAYQPQPQSQPVQPVQPQPQPVQPQSTQSNSYQNDYQGNGSFSNDNYTDDYQGNGSFQSDNQNNYQGNGSFSNGSFQNDNQDDNSVSFK